MSENILPKSWEYYNGKDISFPKSPQKPILKHSATANEHREHAEKLEAYETAMITYRQERDEYNKLQNERIIEFKNDLFAYFDVSNNPKRELAYSIAYDKGHSCGCSEVYNEFSSIVELIRD